MKFAVIGGDKRSALLCTLLRRDGHRVSTYAMERAELPEEIPKESCIQSAVYAADCVILPLPTEKGGVLNAPYSDFKIAPRELIPALWPGQLLFGGKLDDEFCADASAANLFVTDIMRDADFSAGNAAVTAECALALLIDANEKSLYNSRVLVTGWGRLAKHLAFRVISCGAEVCIAARRPLQLAMAQSLGFETVTIEGIESVISDFDFIVNTVPARIFTRTALCCAESGTVIMELASPPGGFDRALAENIGLQTIFAPGLPGKHAPLSAAELIRDAVYAGIARTEE